MSTVNNNGNVSQTIMDQLSAQADQANKTPTGSSALGKDAFLKLLVTQMNHQDPTSPQDNTQMVAQLAQFSSLESMQNLNDTVNSIAGVYQSSQALQASSLVGRSVIVDSGTATVDTTKGLTGSIAVPAATSATNVKVYNTDGDVVATIDLGAQKAGTTSFTWDGMNADGTVAPPGKYSFIANATVDGQSGTLTTYLPATVNSVTMGANGGEMTLNLAGGLTVGLSQVQTIGI